MQENDNSAICDLQQRLRARILPGMDTIRSREQMSQSRKAILDVLAGSTLTEAARRRKVDPGNLSRAVRTVRLSTGEREFWRRVLVLLDKEHTMHDNRGVKENGLSTSA